jgi:hypothetical protein
VQGGCVLPAARSGVRGINARTLKIHVVQEMIEFMQSASEVSDSEVADHTEPI